MLSGFCPFRHHCVCCGSADAIPASWQAILAQCDLTSFLHRFEYFLTADNSVMGGRNQTCPGRYLEGEIEVYNCADR